MRRRRWTDLRRVALEAGAATAAGIERWDFDAAVDGAWSLVRRANQFIDEHEPWKLARDPAQRGRLGGVLYGAAKSVRLLGLYLAPVVPTATARLRGQLGLPPLRAGGLAPGDGRGPVGRAGAGDARRSGRSRSSRASRRTRRPKAAESRRRREPESGTAPSTPARGWSQGSAPGGRRAPPCCPATSAGDGRRGRARVSWPASSPPPSWRPGCGGPARSWRARAGRDAGDALALGALPLLPWLAGWPLVLRRRRSTPWPGCS